MRSTPWVVAIVGVIWCSAYADAARAEVTAVSEHGFVSEHELDIAADPERVYQALTGGIHLWWDAAHSYSGKAENFYPEARAQGCFCEKLSSGGSVRHMQVVFADLARILHEDCGGASLTFRTYSKYGKFLIISKY